MSKLRKNLVYILPIIMISVIFGGFTLMQPANSIRMDVNPSIEIITNRLNRVVEIKPLNLDAEELLENFDLDDKSLEGTVNDLVDLMILTGYISGGKDNTVTLTVKDENTDSKLVDKVNEAIKAMLENKQIEAKIIKQTIDETSIERYYEDDEDDDISEDRLSADILSKEQAERIALSKVDGQVTEAELDDDDLEYEFHIVKDGLEHELKIDAVTGVVLEQEIEDEDDEQEMEIDDDKDLVSMPTPRQPKQETRQPEQETKQIIGDLRAREIAMNLVSGEVVEFDFDDDDKEYEVKIIGNGIEYEIKINAFTGEVIEFESDDTDDDYEELIDDDRDDSVDYDDNDDEDDEDEYDDEYDDEDDDDDERDED